MWQKLSGLLVLTVATVFSSLPPVSQAIAVATPSSVEATNTLIVSLLQQSHELDQQLALPLHLNLLGRQLSIISRLPGDQNVETARQWANELFTVAAQAKQPARSYSQGSALTVLARLDPQHALELLHTAQLEEVGPPSPKMQLAREVFNSLVSSDGIGVLPLLQQEAEQMGARGQYPYAALADAANYAVAKDWRDNRQHAIDIMRSVFEQAFARYQQSAPDYSNDYEFGAMLRIVAGALPLELIQPALRQFVQNVLADSPTKYSYQSRVVTKTGEELRTNDAVDAMIMLYGRLINSVPELAQELENTRPELQSLFECLKKNECNGASFGRTSQTQKARVPDPEQETREAASLLSHTNPDVAISKVENLPNDEKGAATALDVARNIAARRPQQASELMEKAQNTAAIDDNRKQLNIVSAQVSLAAARNQQEQLQQLLQRGFELARPLVAQSTDLGPPFITGLPSMVQIGMQNYPEMTAEFLKNLAPVRMKAELLIAAAGALQLHTRLPVGSRMPSPNAPSNR
ncbi:MAG TPA: hypothetical protein VFA65_11495 [Bryobacteraceae bacterium]|nr:hypothetical protein [Bryobacteraceae bacterium]